MPPSAPIRRLTSADQVRCNKRQGAPCGNCERLGLVCLAAQDGHDVASPPTTTTGPSPSSRPRRLRGSKACTACRRKKTRCSGASPACASCERHGTSCVYPGTARLAPPPSPPSSSTTEGAESPDSLRPHLKGLVDLFFDKLHPLPSFAFLHPPTVKERCQQRKLDPTLAHALCALATRHAVPDGQNRERADVWGRKAEREILQHLGSPTIARLQALILVIGYQMETGLFQRAFMLVATAARFAAALRLNHERQDLDPIAQEARRRTIWSLKIVERYFSVGLPEFEVFPTDAIYLQFPGCEADFGAESPGDGGAYSVYVRLELIRRDIMKLTRAVSLCEQPFSPLIKLLTNLKEDLREVSRRLPPHDAYACSGQSRENGSRWQLRNLFTLISLHQAHCDLNRILLPGYAMAAPSVVLAAIDDEYLAAAQRECLDHALAIIGILTGLNQQSTTTLLLEFDSAICSYHAVRLLLFIAGSGRGTERPSPEFAASRAALCLAAMRRFFSNSAPARPIIEDMERLANGLEPDGSMMGGPPPPRGFDEGPRRVEQQLSAPAKARQRLAIHSLLRRAEFTDEDVDDASTTEQEGVDTPRSEAPPLGNVRGM